MSDNNNDGSWSARVRGLIFGGGALLLIADWGAAGFDLLLSSSTMLFPVFSVMTRYLSEEFAALDHRVVYWLFITFALAYVANGLFSFAGWARKRMRQ